MPHSPTAISNLALFLKRKRFRKGAFLLNNIAKVLGAGLVVLMATQTGAFSFPKANQKLKGARNMMQAISGNVAHPEYGVATIPFPIPWKRTAGICFGTRGTSRTTLIWKISTTMRNAACSGWPRKRAASQSFKVNAQVFSLLNERRLPERTLQLFFKKSKKALDILLHLGYFIDSKTFYENVKLFSGVMI